MTPASHKQATGVLLSDLVTPTPPLTWLWNERVPLGCLTLLDGNPGTGLSLFALSLAACVSRGLPLPGDTSCQPGGVVLLAPHEHHSATIGPRLQAAGGDPSRVLLLTTVQSGDSSHPHSGERPFTLTRDLDLLAGAIERVHASLVLIDPFTLTLSRDLQQVLPALDQLAHHANCAIVLVRPGSTRDRHTLLPGGPGARELLPWVRSSLLFLPDALDPDKRLLVTPKHTFCPEPAVLTCQLDTTDQGIPILDWLGETDAPLFTLAPRLAPLSPERQQVLELLQDSPEPLTPVEVGAYNLYYSRDIAATRQILSRMHRAGQIACPSYGHYTTLDHPCLSPEPSEPPVEAGSSRPQGDGAGTARPASSPPPAGTNASGPAVSHRPEVKQDSPNPLQQQNRSHLSHSDLPPAHSPQHQTPFHSRSKVEPPPMPTDPDERRAAIIAKLAQLAQIEELPSDPSQQLALLKDRLKRMQLSSPQDDAASTTVRPPPNDYDDFPYPEP